MRKSTAFATVLSLGLLAGHAQASNAQGLTVIDPYTLRGESDFLTDIEPLNHDRTVNVVVEIPAGTTAKWQVDKQSGDMTWEFADGRPRTIRYLGYPGNYGILPQTLLPAALSGDGDPLDVVVLGPALPRGSVARAKVIGVLKLLDRGEQDDKILTVLEEDAFAAIDTIDELDSTFPGVTTILSTWFENYKGSGEVQPKGFASADHAMKITESAITHWADSRL